MRLQDRSVPENARRASPLYGDPRVDSFAHLQQAGVQVRHQLRLNRVGARLGDFLRKDRRATKRKRNY